MRITDTPKITQTFLLDQDLWQAIRLKVQVTQTSLSQIINEALREYLEKDSPLKKD